MRCKICEPAETRGVYDAQRKPVEFARARRKILHVLNDPRRRRRPSIPTPNATRAEKRRMSPRRTLFCPSVKVSLARADTTASWKFFREDRRRTEDGSRRPRVFSRAPSVVDREDGSAARSSLAKKPRRP